MVKLNICKDHFAIILYEEYLVFSFEKSLWNFKKIVKCSDSGLKSADASIECSAFSPCGKYFGVCYDKNITIYSTFDYNVMYNSPGERKAYSLTFFPKSKAVSIADKSGCAIFYSFQNDKLQKMDLCLGHNSMLTGVLVSDDEKFVVTCDRDEKIRITHYPNVYNIDKYCLGHKLFVSSIEFLPTDRRILLSSSGDGTIRFWEFSSGKEIALYNFNDSEMSNVDLKTTVTKIVSCAQIKTSILAVTEYKSSQIRILKVTGDLYSGLNIELLEILKLKSVPWDIAFWNTTLVCLLPDKDSPVVLWSSIKKLFIEVDESFKNVNCYLHENWDSILLKSSKISDDIPILFKRELDNIQEYEERKKARLMRTGKAC